MKGKSIIIAISAAVVTARVFFHLHSSRADTHAEYLRLFGRCIVTCLSDNEDYPQNLKDLMLWEEKVAYGGDPNREIESWLQLCVCPLTNHRPRSIDDVDDWADITVVPHLSPLMPGEVMLAYCPAANHKDNQIYVVIHRSVDHSTSIRQHFLVRTMSQEVFDIMLEEQRIVFGAVTKP